HHIRNVVIDSRTYKDDAVAQQARINVICAFAAIGLFDHHRDQSVLFVIHLEFSVVNYNSLTMAWMGQWVNDYRGIMRAFPCSKSKVFLLRICPFSRSSPESRESTSLTFSFGRFVSVAIF